MRHSGYTIAKPGSKSPIQSTLSKVQLIVAYRLTKTLHSKKYGVDLPRFTHKNTAIIYASTKEDDTVRYHSLHDNKYLQYFRGHSQRVISLEMSPVDDGFMSGSMDKTVRLWDLRAPQCRGLLSLPAPSLVTYDTTGVVFAVALNHYSRILMYDLANFDKAPFLTITLEDPTLARVSFPPRAIYMTSMAFSSSGKYLLVGCSGDAHYIIDAFEGHVLAKLEGHIGLERRRLDTPISIEPQRGCSGEEVSWTPDSKYVIGGGLDGRICVWDVQNLPPREGPVDLQLSPMRIQPLAKLDGHPGPARCVRFNPRLAMMATAGAELVCRSVNSSLCSSNRYPGLLDPGSDGGCGRSRQRTSEKSRNLTDCDFLLF
jgi:COMPASS component SWD2